MQHASCLLCEYYPANGTHEHAHCTGAHPTGSVGEVSLSHIPYPALFGCIVSLIAHTMLVLDWTVRILSIAAAGLIIGQAAVGDWTPYVTVMHPVFMTLGCVVFMSNGIVTYVSDYWIVSSLLWRHGTVHCFD